VAKNCVRFASSSRRTKLPEKIAVQLLKPVPNIGVTGQVVRVKPAFMRNFLQVSNKAAYILKGQQPPLPVVKKDSSVGQNIPSQKSQSAPIVPEQQQPSSQVKPAPSAMSLDELSSLFKNMRHSKRGPASKLDTVASDAEVTFTISELKQTIPASFTIKTSESLSFPLSKSAIASVLFELSGVTIPESVIKISKHKNVVDSITSPDTYDLIISSAVEKAFLSRTVVVI
jgi:hypothetical protein